MAIEIGMKSSRPLVTVVGIRTSTPDEFSDFSGWKRFAMIKEQCKAAQGHSETKDHPLGLLALPIYGDASVAIDLQSNQAEKQHRKHQGNHPGKLTKVRIGEKDDTIQSRGQRPARPSGSSGAQTGQRGRARRRSGRTPEPGVPALRLAKTRQEPPSADRGPGDRYRWRRQTIPAYTRKRAPSDQRTGARK